MADEPICIYNSEEDYNAFIDYNEDACRQPIIPIESIVLKYRKEHCTRIRVFICLKEKNICREITIFNPNNKPFNLTCPRIPRIKVTNISISDIVIIRTTMIDGKN